MAAAKRVPKKKHNSLPTVDGDLARLRVLLSKKQEYVAILELELTNTRADLNSFTQLYNEHIAPLQRRANRLRKLLYEVLEEQRQDNQAEWPQIPGLGNDANPPDDEEPRLEDDPKNEANSRQTMNRRASNGKAEHLDPKREEQIRGLFRQLAKRFHPDLTADPDEKKQREKVMAYVNAAYSARDLEALLKLAEAPDIAKVNGSLSQAKQIEQIRAELKRLDVVINELENTIRQIDISPIMQLRLETRLARRAGKELLSDMASDVDVQIKDLEEHLIVLGVVLEAEPAE
ncbi:MAG: hypothetical protein IH859_09180 [Chloroflexi bacterium]|nr:hypothetical protein [Chloroflexota bacterium]